MISYEKALKMLSKKGYTTYRIRKEGILGQTAYAKLQTGTKGGKDGINTIIIDRLCRLLSCQPGDLMEYVDDDLPPQNKKSGT